MKGRNEHKFYINYADYLTLRSRLRAIAQPDKNTNETGGYKIRSLYFDNYMDKAVMEKLAGTGRREKFRIRYYNNNIDFIRLEKKSKSNKLTYKENTQITKSQCAEILSEYECLNNENIPLLMELYTKMHTQILRPKNIVDYDREVYVYPAGNVRITLDKKVRTSNNVNEFLNPHSMTILAATAIILEVKYDGFLPDVMRDIVQINQRNQTEFSKYVVARLV